MTDEPIEPEDSVADSRSPVAGDDDVKAAPPEEMPGDRQPETGDRDVEIAENDAAVQRELRRLSRRGFITLGAGALATIGIWEWLKLRPREGGVQWPLRRGFQFDEKVAEAYFKTSRLSPTFPPVRIR